MFLGESRAGLGFINCDDEEDCVQGSGSGDGTPGSEYNSNKPNRGNPGGSSNPNVPDEEVWYPGGTDSKWKQLLFFNFFSRGHP